MTISMLPIKNMASRHPGLQSCQEECYVKQATVIMDRYHKPPTEFALRDDDTKITVLVEWEVPDQNIKAAFANLTDAKEEGAYAYALASVELTRGLVAVRRMETLTGGDFYIAPIGTMVDDIENAYKLEVSGTELDESEVKSRVRKKMDQARKGTCDLPAIAAVVGFSVKQICIKTVEIES